MANTLTNLIPTLYESLDVVSRELVGFIPAVTQDFAAARAAVGEQILVPITTQEAAIDVVPGVTAPDAGDSNIGNAPVLITKSKGVPIRWNGEEGRGLSNAGTLHNITRDRFTQAFRTLTNMVEADLAATAYQNASRAAGTAGTTPFATATDLTGAASVAKILDDNGAPAGDRHLVLGSAAVRNLRGYQTILLKANENGEGGADFRRTGRISGEPLLGFDLHNSAQINPVTKGTGASYVTSGATASGINTVTLATGTGTVLAGDVVTFAGDSNAYVVNSGITAPGTITLGNPGVLQTEASGVAMTIGGSYTPNVAFVRSAVLLVSRPPASPIGPDGQAMDMADDVMLITDPVSGLTFEIALYRQFKQLIYMVNLAWGTACIKPEHVALLQG